MGRSVTTFNLPYVQAFQDRHGVRRYYFRKKRKKRVSLPGLLGSPAFMEAYHVALGGEGEKAPKGGPRCLAALFQSYYRSAGFKNLSSSSQRLYRQVIKPIEAKDGHRGVADLPDDKARKVIEEIGEDHPGMANLTCSVMRRVFAHAIKLKWRHTNPFKDIEPYEVGTHHSWTDDEIAAYLKRWALGSRERVAFDLLYYTAQRVGDVAKMKRSHISGDVLYVKQQKTGAELNIPVHPALRRSLNAYGIHGQNLISRVDGRQMARQTLTLLVKDAAEKAGLSPACKPHGIRKAVLRQLAEKGASAKVIAALSGHKTLKEIERYTEAASQGLMAVSAIAALPDLA